MRKKSQTEKVTAESKSKAWKQSRCLSELDGFLVNLTADETERFIRERNARADQLDIAAARATESHPGLAMKLEEEAKELRERADEAQKELQEFSDFIEYLFKGEEGEGL